MAYLNGIKLKQCSDCKEWPPVEDFYKNQARCKKCTKISVTFWRENNKEKYLQQIKRNHINENLELKRKAEKRRYHLNKEHRRKQMRERYYRNIETRKAKQRAYKHKLKQEGYKGVILNDPCSYCDHNATSLDHIIPSSKNGLDHWFNLTSCCKSCNSKKKDRSLLIFLLDSHGDDRGYRSRWYGAS